MNSKSLIDLDDATYQFLLNDLWSSEDLNSTWKAPDELSSAAGPVRRTKRQPKSRTVFTAEQVKCMEDTFQRSPYIARLERIHLSLRIGVAEEAVKTWFQNRRARRNRQELNQKAASGSPAELPGSQVSVPSLPAPHNNFSYYNAWPNYLHHPYGMSQAPQVVPQVPEMY